MAAMVLKIIAKVHAKTDCLSELAYSITPTAAGIKNTLKLANSASAAALVINGVASWFDAQCADAAKNTNKQSF